MRAHRVVGGAVVLAAAGLMAGLPFIDGQGGYAGLSPRFLPALVGVGLGLCGVLVALRPDALAVAAPALPVRRLAWLLAALVGHALLIAHLGFVLASVWLMVCAARAFGSRRPLRDALVALALALPLWLLFARGFQLGLKFLPIAGW